MRVKVFALVYGSRNEELLTKNLLNAGYEYDFEELDYSPLAHALNIGLSKGLDYDAVLFLANDIEEPKDWLKKRVEHLQNFPEIGIVSIYPYNEVIPHGMDLIGNYLIRTDLVKTIGFFTESFGLYGPIDLDYCQRARVAGFKTDYLTGITAEHKQWNGDTVYGFSKKQMVDRVWQKHYEDVVGYMSGTRSPVVFYPEYTINMKEYPEDAPDTNI